MTYQKNQKMHKFIDTEPIPSRQELIDIIKREIFEQTYGELFEDYRKHPVRAILILLYMVCGILLFSFFCARMNGFGVACSVCMLSMPFILSPFTPGFTHKHRTILRIIAVLSAILLLAIAACSGLSHFGITQVLPNFHVDEMLLIPMLITGIILLFPVAILIFLIVNRIAESKCTEETLATCIGYDCYLHSSRHRHRITRLHYTPVFRYHTYEGEQTAVSKATTKNPAGLPHIGESRTIWYNPQKHDAIRITEKPIISWGMIITLAIVIILFGGIVTAISLNTELPNPSAPAQSEDGRVILSDSNLNKRMESEAWRIALRTVTKVEDQDEKLYIYFEELSTFGGGIAIPPEMKVEYASVKAGDEMYWVQTSDTAVVFSTDTYVYEGNKVVATE